MASLFAQALLLFRSELRQELRHTELLWTALFFSAVVLVILGLSLSAVPQAAQLRTIPGALWLGIAFTGALSLSRLYDRERQGGMLAAILCSPFDPLALYLAKVGFGSLLLFLCGALYLPGLAVMLEGGAVLLERWPVALGIVALGSAGYTIIAAFFGAALVRSGGKSLLLSMILYPLSTPVLLTALVATQRLIDRDPGVESAIAQLAAIDVALFALACLIFESMIAPGRKASASRSAKGRRSLQS